MIRINSVFDVFPITNNRYRWTSKWLFGVTKSQWKFIDYGLEPKHQVEDCTDFRLYEAGRTANIPDIAAALKSALVKLPPARKAELEIQFCFHFIQFRYFVLQI